MNSSSWQPRSTDKLCGRGDRKEVHIKTVNVKYQVATYSGVITVRVSEDDDNATIIAKAKAKLRRQSGGSLPFGYQHFKIVR